MSFRKENDLIEVQISDFAFGGKGIAWEETEKGKRPIFVPNTLPGQTVQARVIKAKKSFVETKLISVQQRSKEETATPYQEIPGAPYAFLPIERQHHYKVTATLDVFERIGKIKNTKDKFQGLISSPLTWNYRNKMEYAFSNKIAIPNTDESAFAFGLGFKKRGQWALVENLDKESGLFDATFENKLNEIRIYLENTGLPAWNPAKCEGFFRTLTVRKSFFTNTLLLNLTTSSQEGEKFNADDFAAFVTALLPEKIEGILHTLNDGKGERNLEEQQEPTLSYGKAFLNEKMHNLNFRISIDSFFQPNPNCAALLYQKVVDLVKDYHKQNAIMDLFCGTGTIAQLLAQQIKDTEIIGVDIIESAIQDAIENAKENNIEQVKFLAADVGKFLLENPHYKNKIGTIVLDPPRAGITPKGLRRLIELNAETIVYVSCNPATQARDAEVLEQAGYALEKFWLVDQFPHTAHIESIAVFTR
ncbi:MAG: 23S rRNA (uracil(1939)-C(5))-methyltransferase RlmD [Luteibaculaceae bacterium]